MIKSNMPACKDIVPEKIDTFIKEKRFSKIILKSQNDNTDDFQNYNQESIQSIYINNLNFSNKGISEIHYYNYNSPKKPILPRKKFNIEIKISPESNNKSNLMKSPNNQASSVKGLKTSNFFSQKPKTPNNMFNSDIKGHASKKIKSRSPNFNNHITTPEKGLSRQITPEKGLSPQIIGRPIFEPKYRKPDVIEPKQKGSKVLKLDIQTGYKKYIFLQGNYSHLNFIEFNK